MKTEFIFFIVSFRLVLTGSTGSTGYLTPIANKHMKLSGHGFNIGSSVSFAFHVKSSNDAFIRFVKKDSSIASYLVFRVIINRVMAGKRQSSINVDSSDQGDVSYEPFLTPNVYNTFRIGWQSGVITLNKKIEGLAWRTLLCFHYKELKISEVKFITITSRASDSVWEIYFQDPYVNITLPNKCPVKEDLKPSNLSTKENTSATSNIQLAKKLKEVSYSQTPSTLASTKDNGLVSTFSTYSMSDQSTAIRNTSSDSKSSTETATFPLSNTEISSASQPHKSMTTMLASNSQTNAVSNTARHMSTTSTVYSTTVISATETSHNYTYCRLICEKNYTEHELVEMLNELKKKLKWDRKITSSYTRSKTSASDHRKSSTAIGYIGIVIVITVAAGIITLDLTRLIGLAKINGCLNKKIKDAGGS